ncbi:MAG TPA: hypothetical protein PKN56_06415 [Leptospiraceae bacterium]|nr:hypothetical protein [Leptospiraceae bacterium]
MKKYSIKKITQGHPIVYFFKTYNAAGKGSRERIFSASFNLLLQGAERRVRFLG